MAKKILIIDDDKNMVDLLTALLSSRGYEVISSNESIAGVALAKSDKPDLILLDVMMPLMNGYQVCRLLKGDSAYRTIPIVMLTARSQDIDVRTGKEVGVNAYLQKPYEDDKLLKVIADFLPNSESKPIVDLPR